MESKHTNWVFKRSAQYGNRTHVKENGNQLFVIEHYTDTDSERIAIDKKIEIAVNAHDELLSQIKYVLMSFGSVADNLSPYQEKCIESLRETYTNLTTIKTSIL